MPQTVEVDYLDDQITVTETEPSTLDELSQQYGNDFIIEMTNSNCRYRNKHPRVYKLASAELVMVTPRAVVEEKELKDKSIKKVLEAPIDHCRRAFKIHPELTTEVITRISQSEPLFVKGERQGGTGKVSAAATEAANAAFAEGDDFVETRVTLIESMVPGYKVQRDNDNAVTPEFLARGIQHLSKHLEKTAKAQASALMNTKN